MPMRYAGFKMDDDVTDQPVCKRAKVDSNDKSLEEKSSIDDPIINLKIESTINSEFVKDIAPRLSESDVGIDQYVCDSPGIGGIIKQRYADFIVREIDKSGKIVHLSSIEFLEVEGKYQEDAESLAVVETVDDKDETNADGPLNLEDLNRLNNFLADSKQTDIKDRFFVLSADNDKEHRKLVHMFIKKNYQDLGLFTQILCPQFKQLYYEIFNRMKRIFLNILQSHVTLILDNMWQLYHFDTIFHLKLKSKVGPFVFQNT